MPRPLPAASTPSLPILPKAHLPTEQLTQLQRRLAHLLKSLAELQTHVSAAQSLEEWPSLVSRHLALASQTNSLTSTLSLANSNIYNAQLSHLNEVLTTEALQHNKFSGDQADTTFAHAEQLQKPDILFSGNNDKTEEVNEEDTMTTSLPLVRYLDEKNPLRHLAPHPFFPLDSERSQFVLQALLLPKPDNFVLGEEEKRWKAWIDQNDDLAAKETAIKGESEEEKTIQRLERVREQIRAHDTFANYAIRSFVHAREATDEVGQRYDWKIRLDPDEPSDGEDDGEEMQANAEDETQVKDEADRKRKREDEGERGETLSLAQVSSYLSTGHI